MKIEKNMKKIILPMLALFAGVAFTACQDQLEIEQKGVVSTETFFKTDADAEKALASAYENFQINTVGRTTIGPSIYTPFRVLANHPGDDVNYGGSMYGDHEFGGSLDEFRYLHTPEAINAVYRGLYLSIYNDNLVLSYFAEPATTYQKQAVAEARVLRAFNFFILACYWGTPPFVDHLLTADEIPTNSHLDERPEAPKTQQDYFKWVASECEAAVPDLLERKSQDDKEGAYRVTKGFANALAGKALLFAEDFAGAASYFKKVIDSGKYALVSGDDFMDQFHIQGDGSPEKIFEANLRYNSAIGDWSFGGGNGAYQHSTWMEPQCFQIRTGYFKKPPLGGYTGGVEGWGSIGLPEWYADAFVANDGLDSKRLKATMVNIENLIYGETGIDLIDPYFEGLKNHPTDHKGKVEYNKIGISEQSGHYGQSFWIPIKHIVRVGDAVENELSIGSVHRLNNIIVMRYAEVLLDYAECLVRTGKGSEATTYLNMIQNRAGSKTVTSGAATAVDVMKEKSFEMWFEGCRYQDLLRWLKTDGGEQYVKEAFDHLKKQGTNIPHLMDKVFRNPSDPINAQVSGDKPKWQHSSDGSDFEDRFFLLHTHEAEAAGFTVGWQEKHKLFPYPQTVLDNNPALRQNEAWESESPSGGGSEGETSAE